MQPILVTGGTGALGRLVVPRLRDAGRQVRAQPARPPGRRRDRVRDRRPGHRRGDRGRRVAEIVVHCAGTSKGDEVKARQLVAAASRAGTWHLVFISVVGADRVPVTSGLDRAMFGYFASAGRRAVVAGSGLPGRRCGRPSSTPCPC